MIDGEEVKGRMRARKRKRMMNYEDCGIYYLLQKKKITSGYTFGQGHFDIFTPKWSYLSG